MSTDPASLRFLFDENIPRELGLVAAQEGHDVVFLTDCAIGDADEHVLLRAFQEAAYS